MCVHVRDRMLVQNGWGREAQGHGQLGAGARGVEAGRGGGRATNYTYTYQLLGSW